MSDPAAFAFFLEGVPGKRPRAERKVRPRSARLACRGRKTGRVRGRASRPEPQAVASATPALEGPLVDRRVDEFRDQPPTSQGFMSKREPQIILKTDERSTVLELPCEGKIVAKSSAFDEN